MIAMSQILWNLSSERVLAELKHGKRLDGREANEYRELHAEPDISKNADGSARVRLGQTEVLAGVKLVPGVPYPDTPAAGTISVLMELLALASPDFEVGPPNEKSVEIARVVDRGIREAEVIDFEGLCITEGELVWTVFIDMYAINDSGNLLDTGSLAALLALKNARMPKLEGGKIVLKEYAGKLKLQREAALSTFAKVGGHMLLDPNLAEEMAATARFSVATTDDGMISAFQKGLSGSFTHKEIDSAIDTALVQGKRIRKLLK